MLHNTVSLMDLPPPLRLAWFTCRETVRSQQIDTIGWGYIEVDVLEMEEDSKEKCPFNMPLLKQTGNGQQQQAREQAIVLEMNVVHN